MTLRELRLQNNFQQKYVANLMKIGQSAYSMIENGQRKLSIENAKKLGKIYNIDWWLLFESES